MAHYTRSKIKRPHHASEEKLYGYLHNARFLAESGCYQHEHRLSASVDFCSSAAAVADGFVANHPLTITYRYSSFCWLRLELGLLLLEPMPMGFKPRRVYLNPIDVEYGNGLRIDFQRCVSKVLGPVRWIACCEKALKQHIARTGRGQAVTQSSASHPSSVQRPVVASISVPSGNINVSTRAA